MIDLNTFPGNGDPELGNIFKQQFDTFTRLLKSSNMFVMRPIQFFTYITTQPDIGLASTNFYVRLFGGLR